MSIISIAGKSPLTGEMVDGQTCEKEYNSIKNELMQILRTHKLTAGQASYVLKLCKESIDIAINSVADF